MTHRLLPLFSLSLLAPLLFASECAFEKTLVQRLNTYTRGMISPAVIADLEKQAKPDSPFTLLPLSKVPALFTEYPDLQKKIAYVSLCDLPTPVYKAPLFGRPHGLTSFFIKNDGLTGKIIDGNRTFSGNKPRKLEFLLADALAHDASTVLTFGCLASSHARATVVHSELLGLKSICMLRNQPNSQVVRNTLLAFLAHGAKLRYSPTRPLHAMATADEFWQAKQNQGKYPYIIPTGGSCPLGAVGFVNAAFELREQIKQCLLPEPDVIFVPIGSAGTATGLLLGLKAAGLKSRLVAIHVEPEEEPQEMLKAVQKMFPETNELLHKADQNFPIFTFNEKDFEVVTGFGGDDYGLFTPEGMAMKKVVKETENIELDGTYTTKAWVGMTAYIEKHKLHEKNLLVWHTYSAAPEIDATKLNYKDLPKALHRPFEEPVQPLDQGN